VTSKTVRLATVVGLGAVLITAISGCAAPVPTMDPVSFIEGSWSCASTFINPDGESRSFDANVVARDGHATFSEAGRSETYEFDYSFDGSTMKTMPVDGGVNDGWEIDLPSSIDISGEPSKNRVKFWGSMWADAADVQATATTASFTFHPNYEDETWTLSLDCRKS